ncbi:MAG TPA: transglutaminase family protein [Chitinophagaceae bacterium]|nr:transglutaminase family protein [Chitinophagaceae bacterium]
MPDYKIKHITRYSYSYPVIDCTNQIMLYPIIDGLLEVRNHEIKISNDPDVETFIDYFENHVGVFSIVKPHTSLLIESVADVITKPINFPADDMNAREQWEILRNLKFHTSYIDFLKPELFASAAEVRNILSGIINEELTPLKNGILVSEYVYNNFNYQKGITNVETKTEEVWQLKAGVCQDFAHILLIFLRMFEIPSRYVSGYICPKDKEMRGEGATHAWVEAYIPNYGWLGLDPTNNCIVNDQHVRLATGRNFADCTPVKGTYKGSGEHTLEVSVEIKNGTAKKTADKQGLPKFSYKAKNPGEPINSYRYYLEVQQKQQQQ